MQFMVDCHKKGVKVTAYTSQGPKLPELIPVSLA